MTGTGANIIMKEEYYGSRNAEKAGERMETDWKAAPNSAPDLAPEQLELTQEEARERIAALEEQIRELMEQIISIQKTQVDWHAAMFSALRLILKPHRYNLILEREHLLNLSPTRIDCLVVKKDSSIPIDMDVFRLFRTHNVIEMKSYEDALNIDVIWKTIAYAAQYKSLTQYVNDIPIEEVTITIIRPAFPRTLMQTLRESGWTVEERYHNIFYLSGQVCIPIQIVVARDLGEEYIPLQLLTAHAKEEELRRFTAFEQTLTEQGDIDDASAVIYACAQANRELFQKIREDEEMHSVLRELMKDDFDEVRKTSWNDGWNNGKSEAYDDVAEKMIGRGMDGALITSLTGYDRRRIDTIARRLNRHVQWSESNP